MKKIPHSNFKSVKKILWCYQPNENFFAKLLNSNQIPNIIYAKGNAPKKIILVKSSKVKMVYFWQILQKRTFLAFIFSLY